MGLEAISQLGTFSGASFSGERRGPRQRNPARMACISNRRENQRNPARDGLFIEPRGNTTPYLFFQRRGGLLANVPRNALATRTCDIIIRRAAEKTRRWERLRPGGITKPHDLALHSFAGCLLGHPSRITNRKQGKRAAIPHRRFTSRNTNCSSCSTSNFFRN